MRLVQVWGTWIDLNHVLAIRAKPAVMPAHATIIMTLAFTSKPFELVRSATQAESADLEQRNNDAIAAPSANRFRTYHDTLKASMLYANANKAVEQLIAYWAEDEDGSRATVYPNIE